MHVIERVLKTVIYTSANSVQMSNPYKLRRAVSGKTVLVTGASYGIS